MEGENTEHGGRKWEKKGKKLNEEEEVEPVS